MPWGNFQPKVPVKLISCKLIKTSQNSFRQRQQREVTATNLALPGRRLKANARRIHARVATAAVPGPVRDGPWSRT